MKIQLELSNTVKIDITLLKLTEVSRKRKSLLHA